MSTTAPMCPSHFRTSTRMHFVPYGIQEYQLRLFGHVCSIFPTNLRVPLMRNMICFREPVESSKTSIASMASAQPSKCDQCSVDLHVPLMCNICLRRPVESSKPKIVALASATNWLSPVLMAQTKYLSNVIGDRPG